MIWIPIAAWAFAVLIAVIVLGFAGYEVAWKARRLRTDVMHLLSLRASVEAVADDVSSAQRRLARLRGH